MIKPNSAYISYTAGITIIIILFTSCRFFNNSKDLAVEDPSGISFIGIYGIDTVELTREEDSWQMNGEPRPDPVAIDNFLFAISHIEITGATKGSPIDSLVSRKIVLKSGKRKKIYRFYPGEGIGLMHLEGSKDLYRIRIQTAREANLERVFSDKPGDWARRKIISIKPDDLILLKVNPMPGKYPGFILKKDRNTFRVFSHDGTELDRDSVVKEKTLLYSSYFREIYFEEEIREDSIINRIRNEIPFYSFEAELPEGEMLSFSVYPLYTEKQQKNLFYGAITLNNQERVYRVNYVYLDPLFQDLAYFTVK